LLSVRGIVTFAEGSHLLTLPYLNLTSALLQLPAPTAQQLTFPSDTNDWTTGYGEGSRGPQSQEAKDKMRATKLGVSREPMSKETKDKISATMRGVSRGPQSQEHKDSISATMREVWHKRKQ